MTRQPPANPVSPVASDASLRVSVIIPTHNRPDRLAALLRALASQTMPASDYEVLVGLDGPDDASEAAARAAWPAARAPSLHVRAFSRRGQAAVRNALLPEARGTLLVFLNDDMRPAPDFLETHARAYEEAARHAAPRAESPDSARRVIVVGASPWAVHHPDRLFDRLIRETSMVFFHDQMTETDPWRDWGFRHAWLLNLSVPASLVREAGGFTVFPSTYGYEDDEFAYRAAERWGTPVLYRPRAIAHHDHRYEPRQYLEREFRLGYAALGFARTTPACARAMFRREITSDDEIAYSRAYVERERAGVARLLPAFESLASMPADAIAPSGSPHARELLTLIYQQHLPLKRWMWRAGLLAASQAASIDEIRWPDA